MGSFIKERLIWAYCWTQTSGRCKDCTCCYTFKKCKDFVNAFWKIHRYRHYHKTKARYPTTLAEFRKRVNPIYKLQTYGKSISTDRKGNPYC